MTNSKQLQQIVDLTFIQAYLTSVSNTKLVYEIPEEIIFNFDREKLDNYFYDVDLKLRAKSGKELTLTMMPGIEYIGIDLKITYGPFNWEDVISVPIDYTTGNNIS